MIDRRTIFDIHRLAHDGLSVRKIAATLGLSRQTVHKYLDDPNPKRPQITRASKLDPFKDDIAAHVGSRPEGLGHGDAPASGRARI